MKVFVFLCLLGVAYAEVSLHAVLQAKWNNFKASHGKAYHRSDEPKRLNTFLQNTMHIESHNEKFHKGEETYTLSHNHFSDMDIDEFQRTITTLQVPPEHELANVTSYKVSASFRTAPMGGCDWRSYLPPVKNQGSCGSCYAFGSLVPVEAKLYQRGDKTPLSEQQIVDCSSPHGNNGCNGGFMTNVYNYMLSAKGVASEASYAYNGKQNGCGAGGKTHKGCIQRFMAVNNEAAMTDALHKVGPIAVAVQAGVRSFQMYSTGVYTDKACGATGIDHAVAVVGYGSQNGQNYYIVRNSWGTGWGEGGYMKMIPSICQVTKYGYYPIM